MLHISFLAAVLAILPLRVAAQPPHNRLGEVRAKEVEFSFPLPYRSIDAPKPPVLGYYAWRISIESEPGISIVLSTSRPVQSADHDEVMRHATLHRCPSTTSRIAECVIPVAGSGRINPASIKLELRDSALIAQIWKHRPQFFWRIVIEPGGHFQTDQLRFNYNRFR